MEQVLQYHHQDINEGHFLVPQGTLCCEHRNTFGSFMKVSTLNGIEEDGRVHSPSACKRCESFRAEAKSLEWHRSNS
jgi:hypothetical protein